MKKHAVISIHDLNKHLKGGAKITSQVLCEKQSVLIPLLANSSYAKPSHLAGKPWSSGKRYYRSPVNQVTLHKITGDITVKGAYGATIIDNFAIYETLFYTSPSKISIFLKRHKLGHLEKTEDSMYFVHSDSDNVISMTGPCLRATSFAPKNNYGHFWLDHIGQIGAWHEFSDIIPLECTALVPCTANSFWDETLIRIAQMRSYPLTFFPIKDHQDIKLSTLYFIEGISPQYVTRVRPQYFEFTRELAKVVAKSVPPQQLKSIEEIGQKIFLSRRDDSSRANIKVDDLLEESFINRGYDIVRPKQLSISQKIAIASRAKVLAGRWGSGNWNMLFAPVNSLLAEIQSPYNKSLSLRHLVASGQQNYAGLIGKPQETNEPSLEHKSDWEITPCMINDFLDFIESKYKL